jgi:hypothetical protein
MVSSILRAPELAADQNNKYATVNAAVARVEEATQNALVNSALSSETPTANTWTLTETEFLSYFRFVASGGGAAMTLETQGQNSEAVATDRFFCVENADATYDLTVQSDTPGDTVTLSPGEIGLFHQIGQDVTLIAGPPVTPTPVVQPYDIGFYFPGTPTTAQVLAETFVGVDVDFDDDFAGSYCRIGTNPTATFVIDVAVNGVNIGDISISTGGVATFTTDSGALSMTAGQRITFTAPASVDATAADITVLLDGTVA